MALEDVLAVGATGWGLLMAASPALQVRRMLQTHSSRDVSIGYLLLLVPGFILWLAYGLALGNPAIVITNTASLAFMLVTIIIAWRLRRGVSERSVAGAAKAAPRS